MKYETLTSVTSGSYTDGQEVTFTLTFTNNIESIRCLYLNDAGNISDYFFRIHSYSISNNVLTVIIKCLNNTSVTTYLFLLATVASY